MNKYVGFMISLFLVIMVFGCSGSEEVKQDNQETPEKIDFGNVRWGMTKDEVKSTEKDEPIGENEEVILYQVDFVNMPTKMGYSFKDDKLFKKAYLFEIQPDDPNDYIKSYENFKSKLINIFGPPSLDQTKWIKEDANKEVADGESVCKGDVLYKTEWIEFDTLVLLLLEGADNNCRFGLVFEDKQHYFKENSQGQQNLEIKQEE